MPQLEKTSIEALAVIESGIMEINRLRVEINANIAAHKFPIKMLGLVELGFVHHKIEELMFEHRMALCEAARRQGISTAELEARMYAEV